MFYIVAHTMYLCVSLRVSVSVYGNNYPLVSTHWHKTLPKRARFVSDDDATTIYIAALEQTMRTRADLKFK